MGLPHDRDLIDIAFKLKRNMTLAEKKLWYEFLREYPVRFVPQRIIGSYVVDFFCNRVRLSIELDGSQHYTPEMKKEDAIRTTYLEMLEVKELRFPNTALWDNFEGVCESIHIEVQKRRNDIIDLPLTLVKEKE